MVGRARVGALAQLSGVVGEELSDDGNFALCHSVFCFVNTIVVVAERVELPNTTAKETITKS